MFMHEEALEDRARLLVDQIAMLFENGGFSPVSGRIIGHLLLCDPPHQSSAQLADAVLASRGAISTQTRSLIRAGMVERVRFAGDRSAYFRLVEGCWARLLEAERARVQVLRRVGDEALAYFDAIGAPPARTLRLRELRDFNAFIESELPVLIEHWHTRSAP
ncbi:MAG: DNA-binding transcriptional regulator GbsR (MarR family) [Myxococcota bacterium]|jgi:DNA-binding transcriptional regulator GbsR (MarR family)